MEKVESKDSAPKETSTSGTTVPVQDVPDPEEDDLDDLDDMLDEFQASKLDEPKDAPQTARTEDFQEPAISDAAADEFSKQLQEQMAALMGSVDETPEMRKEIEAMMKELSAATDPGASADQKPPQPKDGPKAKAPATTTSEEPFQSTILKTIERMQASGAQATAAAQSTDPDDMLASMLKEMQSGGLDGAGAAGDEEGFNKMLMGMMEQLTNKEILYEPMKELDVKFPDWMERNRGKTKGEDLKRYEEQQRLVAEIVGRFEMRGYSDERAEDREFIVERMQLMQAAGSPPADLVGDTNAAREIADIDSGCPQQ